MAKCSGCSSGISSVSFSDTGCIEFSGDGTSGDPLSATPVFDPATATCLNCGPDGIRLVIDPDGTNALSCGSDGLYAAAGEGGGVPDEHIFLANGGGDLIDSFVPFFPSWDPSVLGGAAYELRGTNLSWNIGNPTRVTINADGVYDVNAAARVTSNVGVTPPVAILISLYLNGSQDVRGALLGQEQSIGTASTAVMVNTTVNGWALSTGDYLEVGLAGGDVVAGNDVLLTIYAGISVTQRL